jgi:hypothetical protein
MPTSIRITRTVLLALLLGAGFAGMARADEAPATADLLPVKKCTQAAPAVCSQSDLKPVEPLLTPKPQEKLCHWGIYDEFYKNGELCRYGDNCSRQYFGTCPDGWDQHYTETIWCC